MSTMEAELVASALATKEAVLFCSNVMVVLALGSVFSSVPLSIDDTTTLHAIRNRTFGAQIKHVALRLRFFYIIRELVKDGNIEVHQVPTDKQLADIGRQAAPPAPFRPDQEFREVTINMDSFKSHPHDFNLQALKALT